MVVWNVTSEIMLVIIYLLEDEQELSLGMLIRPKHIDGFSPLVVYPKWKVEMQYSSSFPR